MLLEALSDHCSLMMHPERSVRPSDCPDGAVYIKGGNEGGAAVLRPITPFPIVIEGGTGNDSVTVVGTPRSSVMISGGGGDDRVMVQDELTWLVGRFSPPAALGLGALFIVFVTIALLGWRALGSKKGTGS